MERTSSLVGRTLALASGCLLAQGCGSIPPEPSPTNAPAYVSVRTPSATRPAVQQARPGTSHAPASTGAAMSSVPPAATAAPTPPTSLSRVAVVERDGIRLAVTLERNPMRALEPTMATAVVTNIGRDVLVWTHDSCAYPVSIRGEVAGVSWRPGIRYEEPPKGPAAKFKYQLVGPEEPGTTVPIGFAPEGTVGRRAIDCDLVAVDERIASGTSLSRRLLWEGQAAFRDGRPPSGRVPLVATFEHYWRATAGPPEEGPGHSLELPFDSWIVDGLDPSWPHPPEIVDAAMAHPEVGRWIQTRHDDTPVVRFDALNEVWEVGLVESRYEDEQRLDGVYRYATVDPATGAVLEVLQRPWLVAEGHP